jgi:hypothetical protein
LDLGENLLISQDIETTLSLPKSANEGDTRRVGEGGEMTISEDDVYRVALTTTWVIDTAPTICQIAALEKELIRAPGSPQSASADEARHWVDLYDRVRKSQADWQALRAC